MMIVMPWQKTCVDCEEFLVPEVFADPNINPREVGNPWSCPKCKRMYSCKEISYADYIRLIQKHYLDDNIIEVPKK